MVLDNASYFASNQVTEFVKNSKRKVTYLPAGSPDLNPVEECWRQFKRKLGNRVLQSIDELRTDALAALDEISPPKLYGYFVLEYRTEGHPANCAL